jgi:hypothetical protein
VNWCICINDAFPTRARFDSGPDLRARRSAATRGWGSVRSNRPISQPIQMIGWPIARNNRLSAMLHAGSGSTASAPAASRPQSSPRVLGLATQVADQPVKGNEVTACTDAADSARPATREHCRSRVVACERRLDLCQRPCVGGQRRTDRRTPPVALQAGIERLSRGTGLDVKSACLGRGVAVPLARSRVSARRPHVLSTYSIEL